MRPGATDAIRKCRKEDMEISIQKVSLYHSVVQNAVVTSGRRIAESERSHKNR